MVGFNATPNVPLVLNGPFNPGFVARYILGSDSTIPDPAGNLKAPYYTASSSVNPTTYYNNGSLLSAPVANKNNITIGANGFYNVNVQQGFTPKLSVGLTQTPWSLSVELYLNGSTSIPLTKATTSGVFQTTDPITVGFSRNFRFLAGDTLQVMVTLKNEHTAAVGDGTVWIIDATEFSSMSINNY